MIIKAKNLTKAFGKEPNTVIAVNEVSINVSEGEFVCISGKSGSGKSTLLYLLGFLDEPTSGSLLFKGKNVKNMTRNQKRINRLKHIGYIFQDYSLIESLTASQNIYVPLMMQDIPKKRALEKAEKALFKVGLQHRYKYYPSQLSGGEKQRVGIARTIAKKPDLIIADEPTANLDSKTANEIMDLFKLINKEGQTLIMVTHEKEYTKFADKVYEMKDGKFIRP